MYHNLEPEHEILAKVLSEYTVRVIFENLKIEDSTKLIDSVCFNAIMEISRFLADDKLDDFSCVEEIVSLFEKIGVSCGGRHDFG